MERNDNQESIFKGVLSTLFVMYCISTQIMAFYFWWNLMKADSFVKAFFVDPFIAEFKGILWPFFI